MAIMVFGSRFHHDLAYAVGENLSPPHAGIFLDRITYFQRYRLMCSKEK